MKNIFQRIRELFVEPSLARTLGIILVGILLTGTILAINILPKSTENRQRASVNFSGTCVSNGGTCVIETKPCPANYFSPNTSQDPTGSLASSCSGPGNPYCCLPNSAASSCTPNVSQACTTSGNSYTLYHVDSCGNKTFYSSFSCAINQVPTCGSNGSGICLNVTPTPTPPTPTSTPPSLCFYHSDTCDPSGGICVGTDGGTKGTPCQSYDINSAYISSHYHFSDNVSCAFGIKGTECCDPNPGVQTDFSSCPANQKPASTPTPTPTPIPAGAAGSGPTPTATSQSFNPSKYSSNICNPSGGICVHANAGLIFSGLTPGNTCQNTESQPDNSYISTHYHYGYNNNSVLGSSDAPHCGLGQVCCDLNVHPTLTPTSIPAQPQATPTSTPSGGGSACTIGPSTTGTCLSYCQSTGDTCSFVRDYNECVVVGNGLDGTTCNNTSIRNPDGSWKTPDGRTITSGYTGYTAHIIQTSCGFNINSLTFDGCGGIGVVNAPTPTPSGPTPTPGPGPGTTANIAVHFEAIDALNNTHPAHQSRKITIFLYPSTDFSDFNTPLKATGKVQFKGGDPTQNPTTFGIFTNTQFDLGSNIPTGDYYVLVKSPEGSLRELLDPQQTLGQQAPPAKFHIIAGQNNVLVDLSNQNAGNITVPLLRMGDINNDNVIDVKDYNIIVDCFGTKVTSSACTSDINGTTFGSQPLKDDVLSNFVDLSDEAGNVVTGTAYNLIARHFGESGN